MLFVNEKKCTGCGSCVQRCPQECISWCNKDFGFKYPIIDKEKCIDCGLCDQVCPIGEEKKNTNAVHFYAAVHKDVEILSKSTSGGAFTAIADYVLSRNGVVYGCSMEAGLQAQHIRITERDDLCKLSGSKYIQSDIGITYKLAEKDLRNGTSVFYTGTPCQIAGLYAFLGREYDNLITADIICHGVGSQKYFDRYVEYLDTKYGKVIDLKFRSKEFAGWSCGGTLTHMGKKKPVKKALYDYNHYYYCYFLRGDIYRESCYSCPYANLRRQGDFTLGDFWGIESLKINLDTKDGCSLLLVNTKKAQQIKKELSCLCMVEVDVTNATRMNGQLIKPTSVSLVRNELSKQYRTMTGQQINQHFKHKNRLLIAKLHLKAMLPYRFKLILRRFR